MTEHLTTNTGGERQDDGTELRDFLETLAAPDLAWLAHRVTLETANESPATFAQMMPIIADVASMQYAAVYSDDACPSQEQSDYWLVHNFVAVTTTWIREHTSGEALSPAWNGHLAQFMRLVEQASPDIEQLALDISGQKSLQ